MSDRPDRIAHIHLDEASIVRRSPEVEHERKVAIIDLLEDNTFTLAEGPGPYRITLGIEENRLGFDVRDADDVPIKIVVLSLSPFRKIIKDYFAICESYYEAIRSASPAQIEAIDMGRRGVHNEGSELLRERLKGKAEMDKQTARRLFTLVCVLHLR